MGMRGIHTSINDIRRAIFAEVARLSYNYKPGDLSEFREKFRTTGTAYFLSVRSSRNV